MSQTIQETGAEVRSAHRDKEETSLRETEREKEEKGNGREKTPAEETQEDAAEIEVRTEPLHQEP